MSNPDNHTISIITDRLKLRQFRADDAETMFQNWASDDAVTKHLIWPTHTSVTETEAVIARWLEGYQYVKFYQWAVTLDGEIIGSLGCAQPNMTIGEIKLGYALGRAFWGRGIATEALNAAISHLFALGYNRIAADHFLENPASGRVMQKAGMQYEGIIRDGGKDGLGNLRDVKQYAILKRDLLA